MDSWKSIIQKYATHVEIVLPGDNVQGEPFWVLMEIKNGKNTGNYHSIGKRENRTMIMLFPQRHMADWAAGIMAQHSNDFAVRGVSAEHLNVLLRLCEDGYPLELVVAASELNEKGELCGAVMSPHQIRDILNL
ncbi:MAG: hypothetical protein ACOY30_15640 [Bacillota bacterium]